MTASNAKKSVSVLHRHHLRLSSSASATKKVSEDDEDEGFWKDEDNVAKAGEDAQIIDDDLEEEQKRG